MKIRVKLFAAAKQRAGQSTVEVDLPDAPTIASLRSALIEQEPGIADLMRHSRIAVNNEYAADTSPLGEGAEVALIPPVSGG
jgi:molybdopterin converting factor subunit 1